MLKARWPKALDHYRLAAMGILSKPIRMRGYISWREKSIEGIDPASMEKKTTTEENDVAVTVTNQQQ